MASIAPVPLLPSRPAMRTCWPVASVWTSYSWPLALNASSQPGVMACKQLSAAPPSPRQPSLNSVSSADRTVTSLSARPSAAASWVTAAAVVVSAALPVGAVRGVPTAGGSAAGVSPAAGSVVGCAACPGAQAASPASSNSAVNMNDLRLNISIRSFRSFSSRATLWAARARYGSRTMDGRQ